MFINLQCIFLTSLHDNFELNACPFTSFCTEFLKKHSEQAGTGKGKSVLNCLGLYYCILYLQAQCLFNYNDIFTIREFLFPSRFKSSHQGLKWHFRLKLQIPSLTWVFVFFLAHAEYAIPQIQVNLKSSWEHKDSHTETRNSSSRAFHLQQWP